MLGFETCGNATVICHDGKPVLCTDPWIVGKPYFGSWKHKFELSQRQIDDMAACEFVWFSHGHPDHLDPASIEHFRNNKILLPEHVGSRILNDLKAQGFKVSTIANNQWVTLSPQIKVLCLSDYYQDATLLIDINGSLLIDSNDTSPRDWHGRVREIAKGYKRSFLLKLISHGDADMMNFFDEEGRRVVPSRIMAVPLGAKVGASLAAYNAQFYVPFSTAHQYQRTDSIWANKYVVRDFAEMREGLPVAADRVLPANIMFDLERDTFIETKPAVLPVDVQPPEAFGDDWSDRLEAQDKEAVRSYFSKIETLREHLDFVTLRVGGVDTHVEFGARGFKRGIVFEAPRKSLMDAVSWQIFDDLLIGNFMKTTLVGIKGLYPGFTPYVCRYSDNGLVHTPAAVADYMAQYRRRNPLPFLKHELEMKTTQRLRSYVLSNKVLLNGAYSVYKALRRTG